MSEHDGFPSTSIPLGIDISNSFNGLFAGIIISCICLGIILAQTWSYIFNNQDVWMLRILMLLVFLLELGFTCAEVQLLQNDLVANFGNLSSLTQITIGSIVGQAVTAISIFCVHCFFMTRVWLIGKFRWTLLPIGVLATASLVAGFLNVAHTSINKSVDVFQDPIFQLQFGIQAGCAAVADVLVTFHLCCHFFQFRTGINRTDKLIQQLIQSLVTRGVLVTMGQICHITIRTPFYYNMSHIYAITMFAILNSREKLRRIAGDVVIDSDFSYAMNSRLQTHQTENSISFNQPESKNISENEDHRNGQQKVQVLA
ncbi:hypothetical protein D9758_011872 [Tetrapyrgos nigripes]|uniref:DUF6534 domain-containing protein n=1 Tax=Tetrapyrgos nigripes TaxID=182062 RepID=A0A8H5CQV7_9AGAR|nr:hypothetical protein D9758_011872 [Tetrapyrgos nigripes]